MGTKTITIMDDAYELLKRNKSKGESFSDVIRKSVEKKSWYDFAGAWKDVSKEDAEDMKKMLKKYGEEAAKSMFEKLK